MIFPFLDGFMSFSKIPITWVLIMINVVLFAQNYNLSQECQKKFQSWYEDDSFLYTQGQLISRFSKKRGYGSNF